MSTQDGGLNAAWIRPATLEDALVSRRDLHARPLAGATDLFVRYRAATGTLPTVGDQPLLYLGHLPELTSVTVQGAELRIGAVAVYTDIENEPATPELLRRAIRELAAPALRNVGTVGGNIANASPAADAVCALYALHAEVELATVAGTRRVPVADLITGPGSTAMEKDELITAVFVPLSTDSTARAICYYRKVGTRRANALSKIAFAAQGSVQGDRLVDLGVAIGAVGPVVVQSRALESLAVGCDIGQYRELQQRSERPGGYLTEQYMALISPISDQRSTDSYRRRVTENLLVDLFDRAIPQALQGQDQ
jgi:xanthine dehydrogenase FAD-binding subunit